MTSLLNAPSFIRQRFESDGLEGVKNGLAVGGSLLFHDYFGPPGTVVWEKDWDVLVILDACRTDALREVEDDHEFIDGVGSYRSIASKSTEWISRTFDSQYASQAADTAYITGNPFSSKVDYHEPEILREVWRTGWDQNLTTVPARPLTDEAIRVWRDQSPGKMIVHYMQPHAPFVPEPGLCEYGQAEDFGEGIHNFWTRIKQDVSYEQAWNAYLKNLNYVLSDVQLLLDSISANTVAISADHGNAMGEWGVYGHPEKVLIPQIRQVPWVTTQAEHVNNYHPDQRTQASDVQPNVSAQLSALGYK